MITLETNYPVALESYDHIYPLGTMKDNHSNLELIRKFKNLNVKSLLDIGCAGGAFVEDCIKNGIEAVGIEGSDYSLKAKRASWATIPNNLFTADATKPFVLRKDGQRIRFDIITCWEFLEHIEKADLSYVMDNINAHSNSRTQLICSISNFDSPHQGVDLHRTKEPSQFWLSLFRNHGWRRRPNFEVFYEGNWVRYGTYNFVLTA